MCSKGLIQVEVAAKTARPMAGTSNTVTTTALTGALGLNTTAMTQAAFSGVKYSVSVGAAAVTFGSELTTANLDSKLMSGTKYFYFSPDGSFFFGGDPKDTDFIVRVCDVYPDGRSFNLTETGQRMRYRNGIDRPTLMQEGKIYEATVTGIVTAIQQLR